MTIKKYKTQRKQRHARIRAKVSGTAERPRLSVFRSLARIYAQLIDDTKSATLVSACYTDLPAKTKKLPKKQRAFELGKLLAQKASKLKISRVVFDRGGYAYHGRVKALADGARDGGLIL